MGGVKFQTSNFSFEVSNFEIPNALDFFFQEVTQSALLFKSF